MALAPRHVEVVLPSVPASVLVLSLYALVRQLSLVLEDMLVLQVVRAVLVARAAIFRSMVVLAVLAAAALRHCSVAVAARHRAAACRLRLLMAGARVAVARCRWARAHRVVEQAALWGVERVKVDPWRFLARKF